MRDNWKAITLATLLMAPLAGCSSFLGLHLFARAPSKAPPVMAQEGDFSPMTRAGREALDAHRPGEALEKFQKALANGEPIAPALNGMAVAYARIDRPDLAERFFREAIAVDPIDQRYQVNLAALARSPAYTEGAHRALMAAVETSRARALDKVGPQPAPRPGQLQRLSSHEVQIVPTQLYPAPLATRLANVSPAKALPSRSPAAGQPEPDQIASSHQAE